MPDADRKIRRLEKGPLQRFKNQNAVLTKFGENGLKVYRAADGKKHLAELASELKLGLDFVVQVADWLESGGMAESEGAAKEEKIAEETPPEVKKPAKEEPPEEEKPKAEEKEGAPKEEEEAVLEDAKFRSMVGKLRQIVEKERMEEAAPAEPEVEKPPEEEKEEAAEEEEEVAEIAADEDEIVPITAPKEEAAKEKKEGEPAKKKEEKEMEISPIEEEAPEKEEKPAAKEEEKPEEKEVVPSEPEPEKPPEEEKEEAAEEEEDVRELNPVEKTIKEKYGETGLKVYALIDGQKTAEEIMSETGVSEAKLIEMLEFMEKQGIIKLEHPEAKEAEEAKEEKDKFAPLAEQSPAAQAPKETNPVQLPAKVPGGIIKNMQVKAKVAIQYGERGTNIYNAIDGKLTDVDLSAKLGVPIYEIKDMLSFFSANNAIKMKALERNEIAKKYGDDCFAIYKKYGKEGVLLYELIGKDLGIRQMARIVTKEKDRFAEMFIFVHKVLGVDIPIDKEVIYAQLEGKK